jgi:succinate dehydrogenase / fumarate reductase iron-sulfur subunit
MMPERLPPAPAGWYKMCERNKAIPSLHLKIQPMDYRLNVWRQAARDAAGSFRTYQVTGILADMSFLEMFDVLNQKLISENQDPVAFDNDCREGICGTCSMYINGRPHGPLSGTTCCQLHMRHFQDGDTIVVEPWRAAPFPVIKDLVVDRSSFDRIIQAGGYISVNTGNAVDANAIPVEKQVSDDAFAAAACIGCGACVAVCPNTSAMLFTSAKIAHLNLMPQGEPERKKRVVDMISQMDEEGFGACSFTGACEVVCPKQIPITFISKANRDYMFAMGAPGTHLHEHRGRPKKKKKKSPPPTGRKALRNTEINRPWQK